MRVDSYSFTDSAYQLYKKNQSSPQTKTTFDDLLRAATGDVQNAKDPKLQLWADYQAWKSQQQSRMLPDSYGVTEENIAYLLENFVGDEKTGELSLYQRMDMIDTMREMGIISEEQMKDCLGIGERSMSTMSVTGLQCPLDDDISSWFHFFWTNSLMTAHNIDDVFEALNAQLQSTRDNDLAEEIREVLDRVRQEALE